MTNGPSSDFASSGMSSTSCTSDKHGYDSIRFHPFMAKRETMINYVESSFIVQCLHHQNSQSTVRANIMTTIERTKQLESCKQTMLISMLKVTDSFSLPACQHLPQNLLGQMLGASRRLFLLDLQVVFKIGLREPYNAHALLKGHTNTHRMHSTLHFELMTNGPSSDFASSGMSSTSCTSDKHGYDSIRFHPFMAKRETMIH